jgi:ubiquinone/menaquinone biosynthesis C-methylase UbiE
MKRTPSSEWLDTDSGNSSDVSNSLSDLRRINRWFGGIRTTETLLDRVLRRTKLKSLSLLEVASASGDVPEAIRQCFHRRGIEIQFTIADRAVQHLPRNGGPAVAADALTLPFSDSSFDVVSCGLFAHHLAPSELTQFVKEVLRVARRAVLINDLVRSPIHLALVYAGFLFYRSPLTRHDGPASVRQAYTPQEIRAILRPVATEIEITRHYLYRMGVILWKRQA